MPRTDGHETDTKHSFRSGSEHSQGGERWRGGGGRRVLVVGGESKRKVKVSSFGLSDPIALHSLDTGGPVQSLKTSQQWLMGRNTALSSPPITSDSNSTHFTRYMYMQCRASRSELETLKVLLCAHDCCNRSMHGIVLGG